MVGRVYTVIGQMNSSMKYSGRKLVNSVDAIIRDNLSERVLWKIEDRLYAKYGLTIVQAVDDFQKLDDVLREFFGAGAEGLEKRILEHVCQLETRVD